MKGGTFNAPIVARAGGQYVDYRLWRHDRHEITVSYDIDTGGWCAVLKVLAEPDDWFGRERVLSDAMTAKLVEYVNDD